MLRLLNRDTTVPDSFSFTHPETGWTTIALDWYTFQEKVREHRTANNLPPVTVEEVDNQVCLRCPPGWCEHYGTDVDSHTPVSTRLTWSDIATGIKAYVGLKLAGSQPVERAEADRRAKVCSSCYLRVDVQGCGSCIRMADALLGDEWAARKTSYDNFIAKKACGVCRCTLQNIVHWPLDLLDKADDSDKQASYPLFCWRRKGGENRIEP